MEEQKGGVLGEQRERLEHSEELNDKASDQDAVDMEGGAAAVEERLGKATDARDAQPGRGRLDRSGLRDICDKGELLRARCDGKTVDTLDGF